MLIIDRIRARRERNARVNEELALLDQLIPTQRSINHPTGAELVERPGAAEAADRLEALLFADTVERMRQERRTFHPHRII